MLRKITYLLTLPSAKAWLTLLGIPAALVGTGYKLFETLSPTSTEIRELKVELAEWQSDASSKYLKKFSFNENELNYIAKHRSFYLEFFNSLLAIDATRPDSRKYLEQSYSKARSNPEAIYDLAYIFDKETKLHKYTAAMVNGKCEISRQDRAFGEQMIDAESAGPRQYFFVEQEKISGRNKSLQIPLSDLRPVEKDGDTTVTIENSLGTISIGRFWYNAQHEEEIRREIKCLNIPLISPVKEK